jgi:hypothetical protein
LNPIKTIAVSLYQRLLQAYPHSFRTEFSEEMQTVFTDAMQQAHSEGPYSFIRFCFRELQDWPGTVLAAHWLVFQRNPLTLLERFSMTPTDSDKPLLHGTPREVLRTSSPLFLFGLGVSLASLIGGQPWITLPTWRFILSLVIGLIPMAVIGIVALYSLLREIPDWSWTWIGAAYMGVTMFVKTASEEQADVGKYLISEFGDIFIVIAVLLCGAVLITLAAFKGWQRAGLFSIGAAGTLALSFYMAITVAPFHRHDLALIAAPVGLLQSYLVYKYLGGDDRVRMGTLLGVGMINVGIILLATQVWTQWYTDRGRSSPLLALLVIINLVLISGPLWAWMTKPIQARFKNP